jgi:hypothetical protein
MFRSVQNLALAVFAFMAFTVCVLAGRSVRADQFDQDRRYGYVSSMDEESELSEDKAISMPELPADAGPILRDRIFNAQLTKEFKQRYEEQFGRTAAEQQVNFYSNPYVAYRNEQGVQISAADQDAAQRSYGNYMIAKMLEYHLDNWAKKDESTRGLYNIKEKLSKFNAEVAPGISFQVNYSISEGSLDSEFKNPWLHTRWRFLLAQNENYFQFDRQITLSYRLESYVALRDATLKFVGRKGLSRNIGFTQSFGTYFGTGYGTRETIGLIGFEFNI